MGAGVTKSKNKKHEPNSKNGRLPGGIMMSSATAHNLSLVNGSVEVRPNDQVSSSNSSKTKEGAPADVGGAGPHDRDATPASNTLRTADTNPIGAGNTCNPTTAVSYSPTPPAGRSLTGNQWTGDPLLSDDVVVILKKIPKTSRYWDSKANAPSSVGTVSQVSCLGDRTAVETSTQLPNYAPPPPDIPTKEPDLDVLPNKRISGKNNRYMSPVISKVKEIPRISAPLSIQNWLNNLDISVTQRQLKRK